MTYLILFLTAFASATLLPLGSEALLIYNINEGYNLYILLAVATIGNSLGSIVNYYIGLKGEEYLVEKKYLKEQRILKTKKYFDKYGGFAILLSWVPIIGDPITLIAGVLKYNIRKFIVLVIIAKFSRYLVLVLLITNTFASSEYINLGKFKDDNSIFIEKNIDKLSQKFLTTKYVSNTLSNENIDTSKENLVINFEALDCFTFIDTLEALKQSNDLQSFKNSLIKTRYKDGLITYHNRNHFFSDWLDSNNMEDITCKLGKCEKSIKYLNKNYQYLKEIPTVKREISYIHPKNIDLSKLKNGDYIGIYTNKEDLDVTHTGIIIKKDAKIFLRHASSLHKKVLDSELFDYTKNKLGILVYRSQ